MKHSDSAHTFSYYLATTSSFFDKKTPVNTHISINDRLLWQRLVRIVRLRAEEPFILFDTSINVQLILDKKTFDKKNIIHALVQTVTSNPSFSPHITLGIGMLKRDALRSVLYTAAQMGVTTVVPLLTEKVSRSWGGEKEYERLHATAIAAAEQSKSYCIPSIDKAAHLSTFLEQYGDTELRIFFEPKGAPLITLLKQLEKNSFQKNKFL